MTSQLSPDSVQRLMREIAALSRAGLPLPQGLTSLASGPPTDPVTLAAQSISGHLQRGVPLSEAVQLAKPPAPPELVALLRCAEQSGDVATLADFAAESARRTLRTRAALESLTAYPVTVVAAGLGLYTLMLHSIMPANWAFIQSAKTTVEPLTSFLYWPYSSGLSLPISVVSGVLSLALFAIVVFPRYRSVLWRLGEILPGIGSLAKIGDFGNLMAFVHAMTKRGVPLPDALEAAAPAMTTRTVRVCAHKMAEAARAARPIHTHTPTDIPATVGLVLQQSEKNGTLNEACASLDVWCRDTFAHTQSRAMARLEPALLIGVGILVALIMYATYQPIAESVGSVGTVQ